MTTSVDSESFSEISTDTYLLLKTLPNLTNMGRPKRNTKGKDESKSNTIESKDTADYMAELNKALDEIEQLKLAIKEKDETIQVLEEKTKFATKMKSEPTELTGPTHLIPTIAGVRIDSIERLDGASLAIEASRKNIKVTPHLFKMLRRVDEDGLKARRELLIKMFPDEATKMDLTEVNIKPPVDSLTEQSGYSTAAFAISSNPHSLKSSRFGVSTDLKRKAKEPHQPLKKPKISTEITRPTDSVPNSPEKIVEDNNLDEDSHSGQRSEADNKNEDVPELDPVQDYKNIENQLESLE